jgi:hypothetical protein
MNKSIDFLESHFGNNTEINYSNNTNNLSNINPDQGNKNKEDEYSILSSSVSELSIKPENHQIDLGFWNNIKKGVTDFKNVIQYNIIPQLDVEKLNFKETDYLMLYDKDYNLNSERDIKLLERDLKEVIWFSYRANFDPIVYNKTMYTSDSGWGCMIRSGQMILARAIYMLKSNQFKGQQKKGYDLNSFLETLLLFLDKSLILKNVIGNPDFKYFYSNSNSNSHSNSNTNSNNLPNNQNSTTSVDIDTYHNVNKFETVKKKPSIDDFEHIITETSQNFEKTKKEKEPQIMFNINSKITPPFSVSNICNLSVQDNKGAGEWFSNYDLIRIFEELNSKYDPLGGLKILNFSEGVIYIEDILKECFLKRMCKCRDRISYSYDKACEMKEKAEEDHGFVIVESDISLQDKNKCNCFENCFFYNNSFYEMTNQFVLFVSNRLGLTTLEEDYMDSMLRYFNIHNNLGIIGGKPSRALYFIGHDFKNRLIFLDPHFVQESVKSYDHLIQNIQSEENKIFNTYKPNDYYLMEIKKMSASFTCGFLCPTFSDFLTLINELSDFTYDVKTNPIFTLKSAKYGNRYSNL